ncbi:hypothetical protein CLV98_102397 [Dyadobacter jejuensis]|uniref:Uncharacterized protein n=1 Tax=Dyadobacter jejuensis TaxID=1082580 RepID=A0A316APD2_9BACT|nr:hypothetical protein [Dyadobacter jejuensis]PWJ59563.1 hypothetical protein CLV98_102397 [Dyadobacter jejuensis]
MQEIEPYYNWEKYYVASRDKRSPFYKRTYNLNYYENDIYGYYVHPLWDFIGTETLYVKVLYVDYTKAFAIIELFGEWNDAIHNDIMFFKRQVIDPILAEGVNQFILLGENVLDFHGNTDSDDYYAEWFEEVEDGWITALNFRLHICQEWDKFRLDYYINFGGTLEFLGWRTLMPEQFYEVVKKLIIRRLA